MVQEKASVKESPVSVSLFRFFIGALVASVAVTAVIVYLNQTVVMVTGRVIDRSTETAFASRKSSYQQEVVTVAYSINGKERSGTTPVPRHGGGSSLVPVHYYPALPMFPWFYTKSNANLLFCSMALIVSLAGLMLSWRAARSHWRAAKSNIKRP